MWVRIKTKINYQKNHKRWYYGKLQKKKLTTKKGKKTINILENSNFRNNQNYILPNNIEWKDVSNNILNIFKWMFLIGFLLFVMYFMVFNMSDNGVWWIIMFILSWVFSIIFFKFLLDFKIFNKKEVKFWIFKLNKKYYNGYYIKYWYIKKDNKL